MRKQKSSGEKSATRARNWVAIIYPESAPENWRTILDEAHVAFIISPLHDQDVTPDGEPKKPHWHVMICYSSVKTREQVRELTDQLNAPSPEPVASFRGQVRYFAHMDNPEKHQYNKAEIEPHGIEIDAALKSSEQTRQMLMKDMCRFVRENDIRTLADLSDYAADNEPDWWDALTSYAAYFMSQYIKSYHYKREMEELK